jgi:predicted HTH domain antitoxin
MQTLTPDDLNRQPQRLLDDAARGEVSLVMRDGQALLLAVPLGPGLDTSDARLELAARLFDREQISLGLAARLAGLSYGEMVDELARRDISVIRTTADDLKGELADFGS